MEPDNHGHVLQDNHNVLHTVDMDKGRARRPGMAKPLDNARGPGYLEPKFKVWAMGASSIMARVPLGKKGRDAWDYHAQGSLPGFLLRGDIRLEDAKGALGKGVNREPGVGRPEDLGLRPSHKGGKALGHRSGELAPESRDSGLASG